jgi:hypothetical protein
MNETPRPNQHIGETIVAAYYLSIFFLQAENILFYSRLQSLGTAGRQRLIASILIGIVCGIVSGGILVRAKWARISAFVISAGIAAFLLGIIIFQFLLPLFGVERDFGLIGIQFLALVMFNLAIAVFFARSWLRDRRNKKAITRPAEAGPSI